MLGLVNPQQRWSFVVICIVALLVGHCAGVAVNAPGGF